VTRVGVGRLVLPLVLPVGLFVTWWRTSMDSSSYLYPPLTEIIESLGDEWLSTHLTSDLLPSVGRFAIGYLLAATGGVVVGTLIGLSPRLRRATEPLTDFARSIPPPLLFPVVLVIFGIGDGSKVALVALGSSWPVLLSTVDGVRGVDPQILDVARSFRLDRWTRVTRVVLPAASPKIVAGLRIAVSVALLLMVVSEMQGGTDGLGYQIRSAQRRFDTARAYAGVVLLGLLGFLANVTFLVVENKLMRWHRGARGRSAEARRPAR
jgi:ABC-type nitrate/sulfonate/bicarbonate transport system permease component